MLIAIIIMAFSQAIGVASVMPFISLVMDSQLVFDNPWLFMLYETFNFTSVNRYIIFIGLAMLTIILFSNAISAFATWLKLRFAWMNNHRLSRRLLEKYLGMPYPFFLNQHSANLSKNVLNEVNQLTVHFIIPGLEIITRVMVTVFILAMLLWVDVIVSITVFLFVGIAYGVIYWRVRKNLTDKGAARVVANTLRFKAVSESFGGIKEIKVMNREPFFLKQYSQASFKHARLMSWIAVIGQVPRFAFEAIAFSCIIIFVLILLLTREDARQIIPLASLFAFAGYRLMPALQEIFTAFTKMQFNQAVLNRIHSDFTRKDEGLIEGTFTAKTEVEILPFQKAIELDLVSYHYPQADLKVLDNISFEIKRNSSVAFVGSTGAGKTTLVDVILGLLPPQEGRLLVDGIQISESNTIAWQRNLGYVPQHIYLSDDTVAANIAFGLPAQAIDHKALVNATQIANIHNFIEEELPHGYDTLVGERGIRLSGGQRQRIGIARALYHDPEVLVFDEATSALDGITEEAVLEAMKNAAKLKTLIIIAHRITTVKDCDMIFMLERGRIVGSGTYDELLCSSEQFKKMAKVGA